jgi:hypothetical protein
MSRSGDWDKVKMNKVKAPCPTCGTIAWRDINGLCPACSITIPKVMELRGRIEARRDQMQAYLVATPPSFREFTDTIHSEVETMTAWKFYELLQSIALPTWKTMKAGEDFACKNYLPAYHHAVKEWQAVMIPRDMAEALRKAYVEAMEELRSRLSIEFLEGNRCTRCDKKGAKCETWRYHARIKETQRQADVEAIHAGTNEALKLVEACGGSRKKQAAA